MTNALKCPSKPTVSLEVELVCDSLLVVSVVSELVEVVSVPGVELGVAVLDSEVVEELRV